MPLIVLPLMFGISGMATGQVMLTPFRVPFEGTPAFVLSVTYILTGLNYLTVAAAFVYGIVYEGFPLSHHVDTLLWTGALSGIAVYCLGTLAARSIWQLENHKQRSAPHETH